LYQRDESRLYDPAHTLLAFSGMHDRPFHRGVAVVRSHSQSALEMIFSYTIDMECVRTHAAHPRLTPRTVLGTKFSYATTAEKQQTGGNTAKSTAAASHCLNRQSYVDIVLVHTTRFTIAYGYGYPFLIKSCVFIRYCICLLPINSVPLFILQYRKLSCR